MKGGGLRFVGISHSSPLLLLSLNYAPKVVKVEAAEKEKEKEIRVCTNKPCRRQGSMEILQIISGIAPPGVTVKSSGCLGRCGAGPNLVVLPGATYIKHCTTAARAAVIMSDICGNGSQDLGFWSTSLEALALRIRAEDEFHKANYSHAQLLLSQALDLNPFGGVHIIYKDRSAAWLAMGNMAEALEDANMALNLAPKYPEAHICQGDVLMTMEHFDEAGNSYSKALELDPSIRSSKSFKARILKLQGKLAAANLP